MNIWTNEGMLWCEKRFADKFILEMLDKYREVGLVVGRFIG